MLVTIVQLQVIDFILSHQRILLKRKLYPSFTVNVEIRPRMKLYWVAMTKPLNSVIVG